MSSGQAAWADEIAAEKREARKSRLEELGIDKIAYTVEKLEDELLYFEQCLTMLSRTGWQQLDRIKALVARLS